MKSFLPPPEELVNLQPEEIGELLLLSLNKRVDKDGKNKFHINNVLTASNQEVLNYIGQQVDKEAIFLLLAEGWNWLLSAGFLAYYPHNDGWVFITRRGRSIKANTR